MKIEFYSITLCGMIGFGFQKSAEEQLPDKISAVCSKKVKLLQFYTEFFGDDGNYLFEKDGVYYYPLTVVYYGDSWETKWISWTVDMSANEREFDYAGIENVFIELVPFGLNYNDGIEFNVCSDEYVDEKFKAIIKGKNLYYNLRGHYYMVVLTACDKRRLNKINQIFMDALALQIETRLDELVGGKIPRKDFFFEIDAKNVDKLLSVYNGKKYLEVSFIYNGNVIPLSISWEGAYNVTDDIDRDEVKFELCEWHPTQIVSDFDGIREFVYEYCPKLRPAE